MRPKQNPPDYVGGDFLFLAYLTCCVNGSKPAMRARFMALATLR